MSFSDCEDSELEKLINMLDSDDEEEPVSDANLHTPSQSDTQNGGKQSQSGTNSEVNMTTEDLGLVLSDCEDDVETTKQGTTKQGSNSKGKSTTSTTVKQTIKEDPSFLDPDELELFEMQARMEALKEQILKKKKMNTSTSSLAQSFTKLTNIPEQSSSKAKTLNQIEKESLFNTIEQRKSEIHSGETDSEDEEDNRNPFETKYSSLGKELKKQMATKVSSSPRAIQENLRVMGKPTTQSPAAKSWKDIRGSLVSVKNGAMLDNDKNVSIDQYSGIKIINPLISNATLKDMMDGRRMIRMCTINLHVRGGEIEGDWVTMGVLVYKGQPKTSQKGSQYSIWQLSDLQDCTKTVSLFLFGSAHKNLWKTAVGTVVGVLNPQIMKDRQNEKSNDILTLSLNNHQKMLIMGTSKDLGWCKGKTKQNIQCHQFVNKSSCEFCIYHIQREYKKTCAKRQDVQSTFSRVDPRANLQSKVLGKSQVFYGGNMYSAPENVKPQPKKLAPANKSKDLATLSSLKLKLKSEQLMEDDKKNSFVLKHMSDGEIAAVQEAVKTNNSLTDMLLAPTVGARNLLRHKAKEDQKKAVEAGAPESISAKDLLKMTHEKVRNHNSQVENKKNPALGNGASPYGKSKLSNAFTSPMLGRGLKPGQDLEFDIASPTNKDIAKAKAAAIVRSQGGVKTQSKNFVSSRDKQADPEFKKKVNKRLLDTSLEVDEGSPKAKKPNLEGLSSSKLSRSKLGDIYVNSEAFKEMIEKKSRHTNLVDSIENEEMEKYYKGLEKKEMLEEKMTTIMEVKTKAVVCLKCKYIEQSASNLCKEENHPLKTIEAKKRFFECRKCKRRTIALQKLPTKPCGNCNENSWARCAMGKAKTGPKFENEVLSLRGNEMKSYSSGSGNIYLNVD